MSALIDSCFHVPQGDTVMILFSCGVEVEDQEEFVELRFWEPHWPKLPHGFLALGFSGTLDNWSAVLKATLFLRERVEKNEQEKSSDISTRLLT